LAGPCWFAEFFVRETGADFIGSHSSFRLAVPKIEAGEFVPWTLFNLGMRVHCFCV
jgi:hypothetical protein